MPTNLRTNLVVAGALLVLPGLVAASPGATPAPPASPAATPAPPASSGAAAAQPGAPEPRLQLSVPLFSEAFADVPVAQVGDEVITVRELGESLATTHSGHEGTAKKQDFSPLLNRIVDGRLIVLEARDMDFDQLPEVKNTIATWRSTTLRETLKDRAVANVKPAPADVEAVYQQIVHEWKVRPLLFKHEEDAVAFASSAKDGATFTAGAASAVAAGKARAKDEEWVGRANGIQQVVANLEKMKVDQVSRPIKLGDEWGVLLLEGSRSGEVPGAREQAEQMVLKPTMAAALRDYFAALTKRYATVDRKLLASLDYRKTANLAALEKDKRPLARIRGEAPVTVADVHAELVRQYFHGLDRAVKEDKINPKKQQYFDSILFKRLLDKEAKEQRLAEDSGFRRQAAEFERSVLFGVFVERVIAPDVKVDDAAMKAYYDAHQAELKYPDFYKLETLAFRRARDAQGACEKLKAGTDVKWLKANTEDQLGPNERSLQLDGTTVTVTSMPEGLASVLSGAGAHDCRMWARSDKENYAVFVVEKVAARVEPFEEAKESIQKKVFQEKLSRSIDDWAKKLRKAHEVKVFVTGIGS